MSSGEMVTRFTEESVERAKLIGSTGTGETNGKT